MNVKYDSTVCDEIINLLTKYKYNKVIEAGRQAKSCPCGFTRVDIIKIINKELEISPWIIQASISHVVKIGKVNIKRYEGYMIYSVIECK